MKSDTKMNTSKRKLIGLFGRFYSHEDIQLDVRRDIADASQAIPQEISNISSEYIQTPIVTNNTRYRDDIIFITSRFRSGSTLLWNLFREVGSCTSYYEPFNERQWFNKENRGQNVDSTHRGVSDYWTEYNNLEFLSQYYQESWINKNLYMTEKSFDTKMTSYIDSLIENAKKRPVLQFNRIDFRLSWIRANYPNAKILHLYRNPRDQWYSFLINKNEVTKDNITDKYQDGFYLDVWCKDLAVYFPMLDSKQTPHPYQRFYYLWKLSWLWGKHYANHSMSFEALVTNTEHSISQLISKVNIDADINTLSQIISAPQLGTWKNFADDSWFSHHEVICEETLTSFFSNENKI